MFLPQTLKKAAREWCTG